MYTFLIQVTLVSALLLCTRAESAYDVGDTTSYAGSPTFSLFNVNRRAGDDSRADREILIFEVPRPNQASSSRPHLVSLENVVGPSAAAQSSAYVPPAYPQSPYAAPTSAPTWNYQKPYYVAPKQERPFYVAIEDVLPHQQQHNNRHFSLFDVNLPAPPQIIINSYPKGVVDTLLPDPIRNSPAPAIDVRTSKTDHKVVHNVETTNRNTEIKVTTDKSVTDDPNRASRSTEGDDSVIIFPRSADNADDSVEVLTPPNRLKRNIVSLENVVGPGQIGYPVYRYPQQPVIVSQPYRYPQNPVLVQTYPQQYAGRQPYVVGGVCPQGNCYRYG